MERSIELGEAQARANAFLRELIDRSSARSSEEVANVITRLAFDEGNPVRELFSITTAAAAPSPPRSDKHRTSSKLLRLARREHKSSDKTPTLASSQHAGRSRRDDRHGSTDKAAEEAGSVPYQCIYCDEEMSSKGVCKRHLDEQHVSPKIFKCERCGEDFASKAEAKKHCSRCGLGVFTWTVVKPAPKKIYSSEFKEEWFSSKSTYLEHLLNLSKRGAVRPRPSLHCKLRGLLCHPSIQHVVDEMSQRNYGLATAWRSMRWEDGQLQKAIEELEDAVIVHENGMIEFGGTPSQANWNLHLFLQNLLSAGIVAESSRTVTMSHDARAGSLQSEVRDLTLTTSLDASSTSSATDAFSAAAGRSESAFLPSSSRAPESAYSNPTDDNASLHTDMKFKRHLSDSSRFYEPAREPPGPPASAIHYHYPFEAPKQETPEVAMPDLTPSLLPYRSHDDTTTPGASSAVSYRAMETSHATPSAATSQTTLVPSGYSDAEFPKAYHFWPSTGGMSFVPSYSDSLPYLYQTPSQSSARTAAVAPEQSAAGEGQKIGSFVALSTYPHAAFEDLLQQGNLPRGYDQRPS